MGMHLRWLLILKLGELAQALHPHSIFTVVQLQRLLRQSSDSAVQVVDSVLSRIDTGNDPIIDVDECVLRFLDGNECSIQELHFMHLVAADVHVGQLQATWLLSDLLMGVVLRRCGLTSAGEEPGAWAIDVGCVHLNLILFTIILYLIPIKYSYYFRSVFRRVQSSFDFS